MRGLPLLLLYLLLLPVHCDIPIIQNNVLKEEVCAVCFAGARCSVFCATSEDLDGPTGRQQFYYDSNCRPVSPSAAARDEQLAVWLWDWSAAAVGLSAEEQRAALAGS